MLLGAANPSIPQLIADTAAQYGVDPNLALEVAMTESSLNQNARSPVGAIGVMQLMPATAAGLGVDPTNLQQNITGGVKLLAQLLSTYNGDVAKALAAYNWGPTGVNNAISQGGDNWLQFAPAETQAYVTGIMAALGTQYTTTVNVPAVQDAVDQVSDTVDDLGDSVAQIQTAVAGINWNSPTTLALVAAALIVGTFVLRDVLAEA